MKLDIKFFPKTITFNYKILDYLEVFYYMEYIYVKYLLYNINYFISFIIS